MEMGGAPRTVSSSRSIKYRRSSWSVHEFSVWSGAALCRCAALAARGSLLLWVGAGGGEARLAGAALALPATDGAPPAATELLAGGDAAPLATRLAIALRRPVYVCCGAAFDRFTLPLVERALIQEIKSKPHYLN